MRSLIPFHAPLFHEPCPVVAAATVPWHEGAYVLDVRTGGADQVWPHLDERHWDDGLARIIADGAFTARIVVVAEAADHGRAAQIIARLARELPEARVALLLGGAPSVPTGHLWRRGVR